MKRTIRKKIAFQTFSTSFKDWLSFFNEVKSFHRDVDEIFGIYIIADAMSETVLICFLAYSIVRFPSFTIITTLSNYMLSTTFHVFMSCRGGQLVKDAGDNLTNQISHITELDPEIIPTLDLLAADAHRTFVVHGGPFFVLNLEFFAALMSAVLTYFVILVQTTALLPAPRTNRARVVLYGLRVINARTTSPAPPNSKCSSQEPVPTVTRKKNYSWEQRLYGQIHRCWEAKRWPRLGPSSSTATRAPCYPLGGVIGTPGVSGDVLNKALRLSSFSRRFKCDHALAKSVRQRRSST
ncbi:Hypothetical predicted protein [Cloeon dipterum]|uniref:Uncharacterized protein n=1 Tax=Cloeon dipterum TaxID=197152 RepID=A0A8S1DC69_9INSE|nr:Hypothetical predicted protein [Cloeon dipterum]